MIEGNLVQFFQACRLGLEDKFDWIGGVAGGRYEVSELEVVKAVPDASRVGRVISTYSTQFTR